MSQKRRQGKEKKLFLNHRFRSLPLLRCRRAGPRSVVVSVVQPQPPPPPPSPPPAAEQVRRRSWTRTRRRATSTPGPDRRQPSPPRFFPLTSFSLCFSPAAPLFHYPTPRQQPRWHLAWSPSLRASVPGPRPLLFSSVRFVFFSIEFFSSRRLIASPSCFTQSFRSLLHRCSSFSGRGERGDDDT